MKSGNNDCRLCFGKTIRIGSGEAFFEPMHWKRLATYFYKLLLCSTMQWKFLPYAHVRLNLTTGRFRFSM